MLKFEGLLKKRNEIVSLLRKAGVQNVPKRKQSVRFLLH